MDLYRLAGPLLLRLDPEAAHHLAVRVLGFGLAPSAAAPDAPELAVRAFGLDFPNPLGLAAGFDKDAEAVAGILGLGFGFAEVGSVTPRPQPGNPRPRLFRLPADRAVINRMGFNSRGHAYVRDRLAAFRRRHPRGRFLVGVNLGKNKESADAVADYAAGVTAFAGLADYLVVNVSSPNTPGLRVLQGRAPLEDLLGAVLGARAATGEQSPVLLKIAPDLTEEDKRDIAEVALAVGLDGLIATNTTIARPPGLADSARGEPGGLSGRPLLAPSTTVLADMYRLTGGRLPLVGVGGVASGRDAYAKVRAGATLVQLYTALVYDGPGLIGRIKRELLACLKADGFKTLAEAVGADHL
jgi:dihydroorotate dehydrogenase